MVMVRVRVRPTMLPLGAGLPLIVAATAHPGILTWTRVACSATTLIVAVSPNGYDESIWILACAEGTVALSGKSETMTTAGGFT